MGNEMQYRIVAQTKHTSVILKGDFGKDEDADQLIAKIRERGNGFLDSTKDNPVSFEVLPICAVDIDALAGKSDGQFGVIAETKFARVILREKFESEEEAEAFIVKIIEKMSGFLGATKENPLTRDSFKVLPIFSVDIKEPAVAAA